jgi:uncharacterized membrane protein
MVTTERSKDASRVRVVIEPNQSLTWCESLVFFAAIALLSLAVALLFSLQGYWPILPFAGLELADLGVAFYLAAHSGRRRQVVTITADRIWIEKGRLRSRSSGGGPDCCQDFPRAWARVELVRPRHDWYPSRLKIGASGRTAVVGEFLTDAEREELKARLDDLLTERGDTDPAAPKNNSK